MSQTTVSGNPGKSKQSLFAVLWIAIAAAALVFMIVRKPEFFSLDNIKRILIQTGSTGIMAFGLTFVLITGGIDISMPMMMLLASVSGAMLLQQTGSVLVGILAIFAVGLLCGSVNGIAVARFKMMPFIVTLVMQGVAEGAATVLCHSTTYTVPPLFANIGSGTLFGFLPLPIAYMVVIGLLLDYVLRRTIFGRSVYAVGINGEAASTCGINTALVKYICYALAGLTTAVGGVITTARLGSASLMMVSGSTSLDIVCAAIIGGASVYGGVGTIPGAFLGALIVTVIQNLINLFGLNTFTMYIIKGCIILLCTYYDSMKTKVWGKAS